MTGSLRWSPTTEGSDEPAASGFMVQNSKMAQALATPEMFEDESEAWG